MAQPLSRDEILAALALNRERIRAFGVRTLALFGSAARNETTDSSDLDFLVEFDAKTFDNYMGLKEYLEALFGRPVDLVLKSAIKPRLREPILSGTVNVPGL
jgi:predicted nucleotidyltransferase